MALLGRRRGSGLHRSRGRSEPASCNEGEPGEGKSPEPRDAGPRACWRPRRLGRSAHGPRLDGGRLRPEPPLAAAPGDRRPRTPRSTACAGARRAARAADRARGLRQDHAAGGLGRARRAPVRVADAGQREQRPAGCSPRSPAPWTAVEPLEPAARETLGGLADALGRTATPLVLALDEADALHTRAAREVVLALAAAMPAGSALALASRTDFALPLGRLRAQRRPIELRADDLALTTSEANALLRLAGLELGSERLLTLMRRTGGWPAGLLSRGAVAARAGRRRGSRLQRRRPLRGGLRTRGDSGPPPRRPAALLGAHVGARSPQCAELRRRARTRRLRRHCSRGSRAPTCR